MSPSASIRIAMTTNDLVQVDASFGAARQIVVYEVTAEQSEFVDCHQFRPGKKGDGLHPSGEWTTTPCLGGSALDHKAPITHERKE